MVCRLYFVYIFLDLFFILSYKNYMKQKIINKDEMEKIIFRMANKILERNVDASNLIVIGIKSRGDILAKKIVKKINSIERKKIGTSAIDITFYRDDVNLKAYKYVVKHDVQLIIDKKDVILVDDVIFTGRSIRAALDELIDYGRPNSIQLAVLIDKGGRELPIQPDYVGKKINTNYEVSVLFEEVDNEDGVLVNNEK